MTEHMRFAYSDPPYLGCSKYYSHPDSAKFDNVEAHHELMEKMHAEYDGWALSLTSQSLPLILAGAPCMVRVGSWVKPGAPPNFNGCSASFGWEPVIFSAPSRRRKALGIPHTFDTLVEPHSSNGGFVGRKPRKFFLWIFQLLGMTLSDEIVDMFPGSGGLALALEEYQKAAPPSLLSIMSLPTVTQEVTSYEQMTGGRREKVRRDRLHLTELSK